ncbi:hypothetical protein KBI23_14810 [bacterium]|nr:hypothetical protein [bacterium]MBP9808032.1 hypothetical protein [bacterium]
MRRTKFSRLFTALLSMSVSLSATIFLPSLALAQGNYQNWYPRDISLPSGHSYPCALTAMPANLEGIPAADRAFINHVYAMLLQCVQAKTVMIDTLRADSGGFSQAYSSYYAKTTQARQKIMAEPLPAGLQGFRDGVINALDQQILFFGKASRARTSGKSFQEIMSYSEGRNASSLLIGAWSAMSARYPGLSPAVSDSAYHHLCALDLF